jgi:hypothetical protein
MVPNYADDDDSFLLSQSIKNISQKYIFERSANFENKHFGKLVIKRAPDNNYDKAPKYHCLSFLIGANTSSHFTVKSLVTDPVLVVAKHSEKLERFNSTNYGKTSEQKS